MDKTHNPSKGRPNHSSSVPCSETEVRSKALPGKPAGCLPVDTKTIPVEFTRPECHWLVTFLEERIESAEPQDSDEALDAVPSRLHDADTVALWLRENVTIDLTHEEAGRILKTLDAGRDDVVAENSSQLASIAAKLEHVAES